MICKKLDDLEYEFIKARDRSAKLHLHDAPEETAAREAILEHKREGHAGEPCPGD